MRIRGPLLAIAVALAVTACATTIRVDRASLEARKTEQGAVLRSIAVDPQLEQRILALDPARVSDSDVRTVLAAGPTPRIVSVHGGIYPVHLVMESFARFLVAMGYPEAKIRHPGDGRLSHSPYESSAQIAGGIAWCYEQEALMPMLVGHSQGGIQVVKVLHELAGNYGPEVRVWNPITDAAEDRVTIVDPFTRTERPVVGLKVGYASVVGAGGAALLLPNQWSMMSRLRTIPDSVEDFTGYSLGVDLIAWDLPGAGTTYRPNGMAKVHNVELPAGYSHVAVAAAAPLARDPAMREWLNAYVPGSVSGFPANAQSTENALWAADVWYSIKKHWVLEAQKVVRAKRALGAAKQGGDPSMPQPLAGKIALLASAKGSPGSALPSQESAPCKPSPAERPIPRSRAASTRTASACMRQYGVTPISVRSSNACAAISPARPFANERLKRNPAGQVVLQLKSPYRDGTTHIVMSPLEFMQRLAALVPRPRLHLIRFHGVLAPHAKLRTEIVPSAPLNAHEA